MNLMGKSNRRLLIHKDISDIQTNETIDIILTPQFYTFLKEELGIKFVYQAKQIAPSIFDDYLDSSMEYQFFVYKFEEYWYFFAYNIDEIVSFLETKGLKKYQINKIFFAQELSSYLDKPLTLSNNLSLKVIDDIVTIIPTKLVDTLDRYEELDLEKIQLNHGVSMGSSYGSLISTKHTIAITLLFTILSSIFIVEGNIKKSSIKDDMEKEELLLSKEPKLSSSRIRKSILAQYEPIDTAERLKRDTIEHISKLISKGSSILELNVDDKRVWAIIETKSINQTIQKAIKRGLNAKKHSSKSVKVEKNL